VITACVRLHDARIHGKSLAFDETHLHRSDDDALENVAQNIALTEPVQSVLGEGRVVGNGVIEIVAASLSCTMLLLTCALRNAFACRVSKYPACRARGQDSVEQRRLATPAVTTATWRNGQKVANLYEFGHRIHEHLRSPAQ
jgi:hypothetical protein